MIINSNLAVISGGETIPSWKDPDWVDIEELYEADTSSGYNYRTYCLISAKALTTTLVSGFAYRTSDGTFYNDTTGHTHTWDTSKDMYDSNGIPYRWVAYYRNTGTDLIFNFNNSLLWVIDGMQRTTLSGYASINTNYGYSHCHALRFVNFKNNVSSSGNYSFYNCYSLSGYECNIVLGNGTQSHYNNVAIKSLTINALFNQDVKFCSNLNYLKIVSTTGTIANDPFNSLYSLQWLELTTDFDTNNVDISDSNNLSTEALIDIISKLKDRSAETTYIFVIGSTNLAKLTAGQIAVATAKNWTLS